MDRDYVLGVIELVRRFLYCAILNLEFLSVDKDIKLDLDRFPPFLNSLLEFQLRIDEILKFLQQKFKIKNKILKLYFSRKWLKKKITLITHNFIILY